MSVRNAAIFLLLFFLAHIALAQSTLPQPTRVEEDEADIRLDGFVDEAVWQRIPVIDGMKVIDPDTLADAPYETHVRVFYTEDGIYVGVINQPPPGTLVARMTSRDFRLPRDGFEVLLDASGELQPVTNPDTTPDDFVISRLTFQARYRWEIAPLSDLFVVYTRGGNLPSDSFSTFQDLLEQSWNDRIADTVAIKLRYRFGS